MGRKCSVAECGSNYESRLRQGRTIASTFQFPADPVVRDRWTAAVGRSDGWVPKKTSCICMNHFKPEDFEKLAKPAKLKPDAVPSLFGDAIAQYDQQPKKADDAPPEEATIDYDSFYALIIEKADFQRWHFYRMDNVIHFYNIRDANRDEPIKILNSIKVFPDMKVSIFVKDAKQSDLVLKRVLGRNLKLCRWSQFLALLKKYDYKPLVTAVQANAANVQANENPEKVPEESNSSSNEKDKSCSTPDDQDSSHVETSSNQQNQDDEDVTMLEMVIIKEEPNLTTEKDNNEDNDPSSEDAVNIHEAMRILTEFKHKCFICDKEHETNEEYDYHLSQHNDMLPFECDRCVTEKLVIRTLPSLNKHFMMHLKPLKCRTCDARFSSYGPRLVHEKRYHVVTESVTCEICGMVALSQQRYRDHLKTHTDPEAVTCRICDKQCITAYALNEHMNSVHPSSASFSYEELSVVDPNASFDVKPERPNKKPKKDFFCIECNKSLPNANSYYSHMRMHRKQFQCGYCGVRIARVRDFRDHENTHTGKRPYECEVCNMKFMAASTYYGHRAMHKGEKKYICDICGRAFSRLSHMVSHKETHARKAVRGRAKAKTKAIEMITTEDNWTMGSTVNEEPPTDGKEELKSSCENDVALIKTEENATLVSTENEEPPTDGKEELKSSCEDVVALAEVKKEIED